MKGLHIRDTTIGAGEHAEKGMKAVVRYNCYLPKGELCGSGSLYISVGGDRETFPAVTHGITGMAVGGTREIKLGPNLSYYERKINPAIPKTATLRYEVQLVSVEIAH